MIIFTFDNIHCMPEVSDLWETKIESKKYTCSEKKNYKPLMPSDITVEHDKKIIDFMHKTDIPLN